LNKIDPNKIRESGTVLRRETCGFYKIKLDNGAEILTTIAAKFRIPSLRGKGTMKPRIHEADKVIIEIPLSQSRLERGMIVGFSKN